MPFVIIDDKGGEIGTKIFKDMTKGRDMTKGEDQSKIKNLKIKHTSRGSKPINLFVASI